MSPLDARLLNLVLGTGLDGAAAGAAAAAASGCATVVGASAEPTAVAPAPAAASPEDVRAPAASDATLGVAVAPVPPESCETGLGLATAVRALPGLFLVVDLGGGEARRGGN